MEIITNLKKEFKGKRSLTKLKINLKDELDKKTLVELPIKPKIPPRFMIMLSNSKFPLSIAAQSFWDYLK